MKSVGVTVNSWNSFTSKGMFLLNCSEQAAKKASSKWQKGELSVKVLVQPHSSVKIDEWSRDPGRDGLENTTGLS